MTDAEFDRALVAAAFALGAERGWSAVTVTAAARQADLPLDRARERFIGRMSILGRFGRIADQAALVVADGGDHRDRLFDMVMRRIDVLQAHRAGVLALRSYLPRHPGTVLLLGAATAASMAWLLEAAGIPTTGLRGRLRVRGMVAVWLYTLRAWQSDENEDMAATMAALDRALDRAVQAEAWLRPRGSAGPAEPDAVAAAPFEPDVPAAPDPEPELDPDFDTDFDPAVDPTFDPGIDLGLGEVNPPPPPTSDPPDSPPA